MEGIYPTPNTSRKRLYSAKILQKQVSASLISKRNSETQFCCTIEIENVHTDREEISFHHFMKSILTSPTVMMAKTNSTQNLHKC